MGTVVVVISNVMVKQVTGTSGLFKEGKKTGVGTGRRRTTRSENCILPKRAPPMFTVGLPFVVSFARLCVASLEKHNQRCAECCTTFLFNRVAWWVCWPMSTYLLCDAFPPELLPDLFVLVGREKHVGALESTRSIRGLLVASLLPFACCLFRLFLVLRRRGWSTSCRCYRRRLGPCCGFGCCFIVTNDFGSSRQGSYRCSNASNGSHNRW